MRFVETPIAGAFEIDLEPAEDERGLFARTFDAALFAERGLSGALAQCSMSFNRGAGTLRGLHYQAEPHAESKVVRCTAGAAFDVIVDLRCDSPTYRRWHGLELSAANRRSVYIPAGLAHGFQTLVDGTEMLYLIDVPFAPESVRGVRWNDPAFGVQWPDAPGERVMSERDRTFPDYVATSVAR
ncbi:MAG: dTDP-4-dehydrorhamnose 3,5-epimerase [Thermoleophilaceae bacterium]|jgi:dTDP-4-dehydrorhamnose 3,5-epimerase|nr:dTDP-4-dehydrorhamnose 3,5-epimerase [Thermoleophilaceae bacterium]